MEVLTPTRKRTFTEEYPEEYQRSEKRIRQHNTALVLQFEQLEKEELMNMIVNIIKEHPGIEQTIARNLPKPTIEKSMKIINNLYNQFLEAIPYNKLGQDRSDYAYNRTKPQQEVLSSQINHYLELFTLPTQVYLLESEYSIEAFRFLDFCTNLVHNLPNWESPEKNMEFKGSLYYKLGRHWRIVVNETGKKIENGMIFGSISMGSWVRALNLHQQSVAALNQDTNFGFNEALAAARRIFRLS